MEFAGKIVVVTGAAKGIGLAAARAFARESARVALLDVDSAGVDLAGEIAGARFFACDVSNSGQVEETFRAIAAAWGGVDFLVNNAGIQRYSTVTNTTDEEWDLVMNVNLKSAFLCSRAAIPLMQGRGGGVVINVSSVQAFLSQNNVAPYTTSKTALLGLTRSIAVDYAPSIRCVAICPGTVDTPMLRWAIEQSPEPSKVLEECVQMHPLKRLASPEEVAELILYACSSKAAFMTGQPIRIDGGLGLSILGSKRE